MSATMGPPAPPRSHTRAPSTPARLSSYTPSSPKDLFSPSAPSPSPSKRLPRPTTPGHTRSNAVAHPPSSSSRYDRPVSSYERPASPSTSFHAHSYTGVVPLRVHPSTGNAGTPAQPASEGRHRATRSVGSFPVAYGTPDDKRHDSPRGTPAKEPTLPNNPAVWSPSELAQHLNYTLRTGGTDSRGPTLPAPVVEDVVSWVLRQRVTGRRFLDGLESWSGARPPPFLPVLAALARRLRRSVPVADTLSEAGSDDEDDGEVTRVKRLAHAFEVISGSSDPTADDSPSLSTLRQQLTGDSVAGFGRATPKTAERSHWARRRDSNASMASMASSVSGLSGVSGASSSRWRQVDTDAATEEWLSKHHTTLDSPLASKSPIKEAADLASDHSPPPPYHPELASPAHRALLFPPVPSTTPGTPTRSGSTPLATTPLREEADMESHEALGLNPYATLRPTPSKSPRSPLPFAEPHWSTTRRTPARTPGNGSSDGLTPLQAASPGSAASTPVSPAARRRARREQRQEMEKEVASLTDRIRELEARLAAVEVGSEPASAVASAFLPHISASIVEIPAEPENQPEEVEVQVEVENEERALALAKDSAAARHVARGGDADGLEPRLRDMPVVVFLMGLGAGVGFSAVVVRVLMGRKV